MPVPEPCPAGAREHVHNPKYTALQARARPVRAKSGQPETCVMPATWEVKFNAGNK